MKKSALAICMIIYLLAVTLVFSFISVLCNGGTILANPMEDGMVDLTGINFDNYVASISTDAAFIYDEAFYTPQDFALGKVTEEGIRITGKTPRLGDFGTVRFVIRLPAGKVYALSSKSASYAQRLFINGKEYMSIGKTGSNVNSVSPKITRYTEAFLPQSDTTEIILHYSSFVHPDAGYLYVPRVGYVNNISRVEQLRTFQVVTVTGALITAMLFFFGLFLFNLKSRYLLWFSLACGCIALRGLITGDKALMLLSPDLSWYVTIRLEYLSSCGMIFFSSLYLNGMFSGAIHKWASRGFTIFCLSNAVFFCLAPPIVFTHFVWFSLAVTIVFFIYSLIRIFSTINKNDYVALSVVDRVLLLGGLSIYLVLSGLEIYAHENIIYLWGLDYAQVGMMIFLFLNLLTLALDFSRTRRKLDSALQSEREMEESNRMLERLDKLKTDFLSNISHEMRTPLMVMSGYAQLTDWQIGIGSVDGETQENLRVVSKEALRLAELASGLLRVSAEAAWERGSVDLKDIFERTVVTCRPIVAKYRNRLETNIEEGLPLIKANENMIFQVLLNLIVNANRHTKDGVIRLGVRRYTDVRIAVSVEDNGEGIAPELLPHVFERHVSGDGGSGLGLAICRDVVEAHGGTIAIENMPSKGTCITFILPTRKEEAENESDHTVG